MSFLYKINLDFAGVVASFICAIHCMAVPLVLSFGLIGSGHWVHNHTFDFIVIILGIFIAGFSLLSDYRKHNSFLPILLIVAGFTLLLIGLLNEHSIGHMLWSVAGSTLVMTAHITNWRLVRRILTTK